MTISVIIPAYNAETTLGETLATVLAQTRLPEQTIVVDDGSTDRTAEIAAASSLAVTIVRQSNRGAAAAMNAGVELATGNHIAFVDADDLWTKDKLAAQMRVLDAGAELDGVGGYLAAFLCPNNDPGTNQRYRVPTAPEPSWLPGAMLLRRRCFERCGSFDEQLRAGFFIDWYDRAKAAELNFAMLPDVVLHRRIHPGSLSHRSTIRDESMVEMARRAIERRRARGAP